MRTVTSMPPPQNRRTKASAYDKFFDGRIWEITTHDFPHALAIVRSTLIRRANRLNLRLQTAMRHDPERLYVQRLDKEI